MASRTSPRRQERGRRRMELILDAAAEVFAAQGYEKATTNAIADRAGVSPGSLYQFFDDKGAIAEALAERYMAQIREAHEAAFDVDAAALPLRELLDRVVDPLVAFNVANPAVQRLLHSADVSPRLAGLTQGLQSAVLRRVEALLAARAPALASRQRRRVATVVYQTFKGMLPVIMASRGRERAVMVRELKTVLGCYLEECLGGGGSAVPPRR